MNAVAFVQIVTFQLGGEEYGVDILSIYGIVKSKNYIVHKIPVDSKCLEGIINLRGAVNPIFNLKKKFEFEVGVMNNKSEVISDNSEIVIVNNGASTIGFIVDEVTDIHRMNDEEILPMPSAIEKDVSEYLVGIGKVGENLIPILDLLKTLSADEIGRMRSISNMDLKM